MAGKKSDTFIEDFEKSANKIKFNRHRHRKNNDLVAAMYAMYLRGPDGKPCSLEKIAKIYKRTRQAVYDTFRSRGYNLRSKELRGLQVLDGIKFTEMKGGYLRGSFGKRRLTMQKYVWEKERGPVKEGFVIYHIDGDKQNNNLGNLELVAFADMQKKFNPKGINQFTKKP